MKTKNLDFFNKKSLLQPMYGKRRAHVLSLTYAKTLRRWDLVCYMSNFLYLDHYSLTFSYPTAPQCSCTLSLMYCQEPRRFCWALHSTVYSKAKRKNERNKRKMIQTLTMLSEAGWATPFLFHVQLRRTYGDTL